MCSPFCHLNLSELPEVRAELRGERQAQGHFCNGSPKGQGALSALLGPPRITPCPPLQLTDPQNREVGAC